MLKANTLLCTVGTSLIYPNLSSLANESQEDPVMAALAKAYSEKNWQEVALQLGGIPPTETLCGAEINSVEDLLKQGQIERVNLHLLHSDTDDGEAISEILQRYFRNAGWAVVERHCIEGLRDNDPREFRTHGLRNLAKVFGDLMRNSGGPEFCAINATGGYKAQIAIAVLMGQALDIPVYYKHDRFDASIRFPPMPVALDFSLWENASGMFMKLSEHGACEPYEQFSEDWDERFEPLVERVDIDGKSYLELSTTGQIFHETFFSRFQQTKAERLPRNAAPHEKGRPSLGDHSYDDKAGIERLFQEIIDTVGYVRFCHTTRWIKDLPESPKRFRKSADGVQGIHSNGTWCVKFKVYTTADDDDHGTLSAVVADLNQRVAESLL